MKKKKSMIKVVALCDYFEQEALVPESKCGTLLRRLRKVYLESKERDKQHGHEAILLVECSKIAA